MINREYGLDPLTARVQAISEAPEDLIKFNGVWWNNRIIQDWFNEPLNLIAEYFQFIIK